MFDLQTAMTHGYGQAGYLGTIPVGLAPVGLAVSPDGRWLYATSEVAAGAGPGRAGAHGTLSVISVLRAETDPAQAVASTVDAGCEPVRVITSADGRVVWVDQGTRIVVADSNRFQLPVLVTNFASRQVEVVNVAGLP